MTRRLAFVAGWLAAACGAGAARPASCADRPLSSAFPGQPADALIRRLSPAPAATQPAGGPTVRRGRRWDAKRGALLLDATLTNAGAAARPVGRVDLIDWRFRLAETADALRYRSLTYRKSHARLTAKALERRRPAPPAGAERAISHVMYTHYLTERVLGRSKGGRSFTLGRAGPVAHVDS